MPVIGLWRARARGAARQQAERAFGMRLVVTLIVTLAAIGAAQYFLTGPRLIETALTREIEGHRSEAALLERIHASNRLDEWTGDVLPINVEREIMNMGYRSNVRMARLVAADGTVLGVGLSHSFEQDDAARALEGVRVGERVAPGHRALVEQALESRAATATREPLADFGELAYHIPLELGGVPFVLEVVTDGELIRDQQDGLNRLIATMVAVGIALGVPVFYFAGGRRLKRRHATAVRHSIRDGLTGLGNHRTFQEEAGRAVQAAARHAHPLALALVDLDDFKVVNDSSGHRVGDEVLVRVARILGSGRPEDQVFRVGGDEFALLLPFTDASGSRAVAERLREQVERANRGVTLSVGVAAVQAGCADVETLWEHADIALYEAKRLGRNRVVTFCDIDGERRAAAPAKGSLIHRLIAVGRMGVAFQPIWDLGDQALLGFEALARPPADSGLGSPLEMFDAADRLGRVAEVDHLCRTAIFSQVDDLPDGALLFVNLAPASLGHELAAAERLAAIAAEAGLRTDRVVLELTERTLARRSVLVREASHLQTLGFKIAIDDVGAGNAGLEVLRQMPAEFIKVDRSVVTAALDDARARAVVRAIVTFANDVGAYIIAEGIEDDEHLRFVRALPEHAGRDLQQIRGAQGYLLGRPGQLTAALPEIPASV